LLVNVPALTNAVDADPELGAITLRARQLFKVLKAMLRFQIQAFTTLSC
jgi:hypothetical protein